MHAHLGAERHGQEMEPVGDPPVGARPVRRVIQERVEDEVAEHILKEIFQPGDTIRIVRKGKDKLEFLPGKPAPKEETVLESKQAAASEKTS